MAKRGLGRGLSALIPSFSAGLEGLEQISLENIVPNPNQPRKHYDPEAFEELVASIVKHGLVQPVVVRLKGDSTYELVAGERRWRAAKEAGLTTIPAIIKKTSEGQSLELALIENIQREDLNALEEATAYQQLIEDFKMTQAEIASAVGKNRSTIANTIRLLQLSSSLQNLISEGQLSSGHARALLVLESPEEQEKLAQRVISEGLSVRQTESLARIWQLRKGLPPKEKVVLPPSFKAAARRLGKIFGTRVKVKMAKGKGKIEIEFNSEEKLEEIFRLVLGKASD